MNKESHKELKRELDELGSSLGTTSPFARHGFDVPENYFDSLPMLVQNRIQKQKETGSLVFSRFHGRLRPAHLIYTLAFVIILGLGILWLNQPRYVQYYAFDDDTAIGYISHYAELDPHYLFQLVLDSGLTNEELQFGVSHSDNDEYEETLIYYLHQMTEIDFLDPNDLINQILHHEYQ